MTAMVDSAALSEKTVQAVARKPPVVPRSRRHATKKGARRSSNVAVMRVDKRVWEAVKKTIRPGQVIVIVSEHEVWLRNRPE